MTKGEAIYLLRNTAWLGSNDHRDRVEEAVKVAVDALEAADTNVDSVNRSEPQNTWIPCGERLPDAFDFCLVTKRQKTGELQVAIGKYSPLFGWSGNGSFKDVLAWQQLPEPYRKEKKE